MTKKRNFGLAHFENICRQPTEAGAYDYTFFRKSRKHCGKINQSVENSGVAFVNGANERNESFEKK